MTLIHTMLMVGLFGLAMHLELYWVAGSLVMVYLISLGLAWRRSRVERQR